MIALWDLGNVAVNWDPEAILTSLEFTDQHTDFVRQQLFNHPDWLDIDRGVKTEEQVAQRLVMESDLSAEQVARCFEAVRESLIDVPQTIELMSRVKGSGAPMYVLSNMGHANYDYLSTREYFNWFEGVVISAQERMIKPDRELFELVVHRYNLKASEVFFIDDSLANIEAARSIGMQAHHFKRSDDCYKAIGDAFGL